MGTQKERVFPAKGGAGGHRVFPAKGGDRKRKRHAVVKKPTWADAVKQENQKGASGTQKERVFLQGAQANVERVKQENQGGQRYLQQNRHFLQGATGKCRYCCVRKNEGDNRQADEAVKKVSVIFCRGLQENADAVKQEKNQGRPAVPKKKGSFLERGSYRKMQIL